MATASHASELKSQGALEAARDPDSNVTAQAAENTAVEEAKKSGSVAYQFDPNASSEEKRAQARSVRIWQQFTFPTIECAFQSADWVYDSTYHKDSTTSGSPMLRSSPPML